MPSLAEVKQRISAAYDDESAPGLVVVMQGMPLARRDLIAWAIHDFMKDEDPADLDPRVLYVTNQTELMRLIARKVRKLLPGMRWRVWELVHKSKPLHVPMLNFASRGIAVQMGERLEPDSLELLVADERSPGELENIAAAVAVASPLFVLVFTTAAPGPDSPWARLGAPLTVEFETEPSADDLPDTP